MEVSLNMFKAVLSTLPISYYAGRQIEVGFDEKGESSYYAPLEDRISISFPSMCSIFEHVTEVDDVEGAIRGVLYHEVSHAMLTPKDFMDTNDANNRYLFNVFEDERIETVFKDKYYGVNFKRNIVMLNNYQGEPPKNAFEDFYHTVRFRAGKSEHIEMVNNIIEKYYGLNMSDSGWNMRNYQEDIINLFNKIAKDWYENNDMETLKDFDENYDSRSMAGKEQSAGQCARDQNNKSGNTMGDDTITTIILVDDDYDENGHNNNPNKGESGGGNTLIVKPGSEPGKGDGNGPSNSGKAPDDKAKKEKEKKLQDILDKIDKNCRIIDERKKKAAKQDLLDSALNKFIDNNLTDEIAVIFQNFTKRRNRTAPATQGYFGTINPYEVGRKDWKIFTHKADRGSINGYDKLHLNLFIDTSGSFNSNQDKVNTILKSLDTLEKRFPFFEFDLVSCQVGEQLHGKNQRFIRAYGGNDLDNEIHEIFRKLQKHGCFNCNIILFDGDAFTDCRGSRSEHQKNFSAFNSNNCSIISDSDNQEYIEKYAPKSYKIFVNNRGYSRYNGGASYSQMLYDNILQVLHRALV